MDGSWGIKITFGNPQITNPDRNTASLVLPTFTKVGMEGCYKQVLLWTLLTVQHLQEELDREQVKD